MKRLRAVVVCTGQCVDGAPVDNFALSRLDLTICRRFLQYPNARLCLFLLDLNEIHYLSASAENEGSEKESET